LRSVHSPSASHNCSGVARNSDRPKQLDLPGWFPRWRAPLFGVAAKPAQTDTHRRLTKFREHLSQSR
jgi:hypothetical protein